MWEASGKGEGPLISLPRSQSRAALCGGGQLYYALHYCRMPGSKGAIGLYGSCTVRLLGIITDGCRAPAQAPHLEESNAACSLLAPSVCCRGPAVPGVLPGVGFGLALPSPSLVLSPAWVCGAGLDQMNVVWKFEQVNSPERKHRAPRRVPRPLTTAVPSPVCLSLPPIHCQHQPNFDSHSRPPPYPYTTHPARRSFSPIAGASSRRYSNGIVT